MTKIGVDAFGGDNGEIEVLKAVIDACKANNDIEFHIYGDCDSIKSFFSKELFDYEKYNIVIKNSKEKIEMNDHPVFALRSKPESSIFLAGQDLINNTIDVFISAGNTGALVALAQFYLKPIKGVDRPVVAAILPTEKEPMLLIDSGCNVDSKPEWLYQYSILGELYYKKMFDCKNPRIGLLSVGTEENKGNTLTLSAYKLIKDNDSLNFIGNLEARDIPFGVCEVLVTDGFPGNVFLKTYEGTAKLFLSVFKKIFYTNLITKFAAIILKPYLKKTLAKYDAKIYGGAPIIGANGLILKCHGNASCIEYSYAIKQAIHLTSNDLINYIKKSFEVLYE